MRVDGGKKGGSSFELKYHPGQVNAQAAADANVAGHYGIYGGPFGGKGHLAAAADANAGLSYDGGHFEVITKTGGEGGSVIDVSAKGDLSAKADAQASGSHEAEVFVDGGKHGGDMTKFVYTPGQIRADADANAQAAGHLGYAGLPGHFMGQLKADAAAKSDLAFDGGSFSFTHYGDEGHLGDIKAALKGDLEAAADAQVSGSHDAAVRVDGGKKGGSSFELKYHPGQVNAQAAADANVAGHYGIYGGPFGGKGHLAAAADANAGLSYDGGHFEVITKTGGEGGSVIDVSAKGDLSAKADAQASGSHEAEVFVDGGKHGGDMTKFVYTPGQIRADADANAQAAGHLGYAGLPGHFMGQLKADAAAKSDLAFDGGSFSFTHYGDEGHLGDIKAALKGDLEAAADAQVSGSHDAAVRVDGGKKGGSSFELKYHPGQVNAQAAADANVAGHYGIYGGPFGGKGHLAAAADANAGLSYDGGHFEVITKTGGEGGSVIDVSAKGDLSAKADAQASGSHEAEVFVDGGKHGGDMTKFVYTPGQIRADADANAQAAGHLGYAGLPGHFMGQLKADAAAKSDLAFDGGSFSFTHYGDEGHLGDIKAALKGDLEAAADAQVSGSHDAAVRVDGGKKGGSSFELKYHPGQVNAQAAADANVAGHYGIYGGPFGGKGHLAAAADANAGLSYDGGHFEVITKTGGEGGSVIDVSAKGDLSAKADAQASGSHEAEVFVDGGKHGGDMTKFVYTPGQIRADADANAQAAGHLGYAGLPGHFMGQLKADAAAKSDLAFDGGSFSFTHYGDEGHLGDIKAALKGDLEAAADAQVSGSHDAAVRVDGGKKGGSSFELKYHPGQVNAQAAADANVAGHYGIYGGPFGGKGHLAAAADANAGLSYDGGHFEVITKTGGEGGSVIDVSAKGDLSAKADAQASGSHEAEVFVDGGKHGGDMTKFVYTPGQIRADADANAQAAGHLGYAGLPGHFMGQLKADAAAKSDLAFDGGSFSFTHYGDEGHLGDIKAALKGDLEAAADAQVSGSHDAAVRVDGGKKGGSSFELKYHPGQVNAQAAADANVAGHYGIYGGPFGGKGHLAAAADANAGLSYDGGHFEVITKTGGEGGSVIDVSAKGDLSAKADAQASGSHEAEVFVDGGKHGGDMTKFVYTPGQIRADADANAQAAGHLGYAGLPGHFMGQLKADAAAKSDLAFDGGSFSFTHYGDEGHLGDIKAALKGDLEAAADAQVSGSHDAAVRVDGGKKGGSSFELKYHPGQVNAQAAADANVAGHYGIYGGPFGGKGHLAAAADANAGLSYDGGHFEVITKTGGEGGSVIDVSAKGDLSAKADAQASGSHEAEVFVDGGKHGGDMTKFVYTPGQIRADADANAQAAGHLGYAGLPGHFMGQLKADAAAKSDLAFDGGSFSFTHYGDEGHLGDIKAALKGDLEAAADAQVSGSHDAAVRVDGGKKGGSSFELKYHPGQVNAQAAADANVAGHYGIYGGPFGGKGHLAAAADANAGLSYDGGHFEVITKTGGEGGSVIDVSAKGDLSAKADAQASGSHEAEVFVDGGKHGGDMTKFVYTPGQIRADADANAQAAGHLGYAGLPGHFMGQLKADAAAKSDLAFDGGSFSFTHYGDEGHLGDIKAALKGDLEAAADAQVSGSHDAAVRVDGGKKGGSSFELKYHPGQVNAQAAADANVAGHYGIYGGPFGGKGHLAAAADANAGLSYDGGHFEVITKTGGEGGSVIDVSAKGDLSAKADAQASGSHEAEVFVDGGKHGGDMTKFVYTPGQIRADADANAQAAGHLGYAGLPGHFMGQLKADAAAKSDLAFDGGSFSFTHYGDEGHLGDIKAALKGDLEAAADAQVSGSHDAAVRVDGGKKGGSSFELKYHPGQVNAQAAADANVAGHYGIYGGPFGGKGHLAAAADANAGLSYDGGHFEVITKTGGEGGSVIDVSAKGDLSAKADAQASGSHEAEVFVDGGKHGGDMTKFVYTPGQIRADADANAQAAGHLGYAGLPGHFMGQLKADAAAKSDLAFDGGSFSFTHYGDEGHLGDIKAALKGDLEAAADAQVSGSHDAAVRVDGGKKGGSSFELKYHPGQVNAQAAADANVAGHYGIYGGPFGGKGHLAAAADANAGLSYDGGHFEVITKTGGEGGSVIDVSAKGDLSAKADAQASGSHEAEVFVDGGKHGGDMTKFVYTPGQIRADADANAQAAGHLGYAGLPGHFMGQLKADAAAKSDLAFDGGSFSFTHYGDEGHLGDIKAALKGDLEAAADAQVSGSHDAAVRVDGGKKGGSSFELKYHPGQVNAQAAADANVAGHYGIYGGPFGGKGHLAAAADANAGLSYDGGHFEVITKTGGEGGSVIDVSAKGDLSAKADAQASGSHEAEVFVDGGKHGGDMTKFVYTPGQIRADADANAQAAGHLGYAGLPGHFMGQLKADAAAKSDLAFDGGSFSFTHYGDEGHLGDIKAALKGDLEAAADAQVSGSHDAAVRVDGGKKGGSSFELKYHPGQVNAQAAADANVAGHYGIYGGPFGGKGHLAAAADANAGLSYDGGHFEVITKTGGEGGSVIDVSAKGDLSAKADAQASGSHEAEVFVDGGKHGGDMTKFVYTPGQIRADADANAQAAGHLGYAGLPGHFMGQLKADAAAKSDLAFDGGSFSFTHYGDEGHLGDIKAALKGDLEAAADAQVSGSHDAAVRVDGGKKGGSSFELKYHPGQVNAQAAADANVAGHYGIYGGPFGGKGHLAAAADANAGLSYDGGHFEVITKTGGEGGSVIDVSAKGDLSAKADAQASGSHEAEVFVDGGKHGGDMTKFVYTPGQIRADADANAQAAGHLGYAGLPGHFMGQLKADAAAKSDLAFDGGSFSFTHYGDEGHLGDIKAALKGDLEAAADAQVSGSHDAAVRVDGGKKGGSSFELKYHPGQVNAQAAADANVAGHYGIYGGPFGGKGHLAAAADANAGLSYDGGHFEVITKTGGEGGSVIDVSAKGDLSAKADAQASGSHEAEVFVDGGKHGGDMTKFVYTPGQIRADADANAQAAGHLGYAGLPGHFMGQLKADAAAKSDLAFDGGSFSFTHYGDEGHLGDIKAALKGDLEAAADAQVSGSHDAAVRVDGGKKGGSSFELKYHPGQVNAQAAADANVAGHYGIYGGPFGGKGHLAAAADANAGLSYDGGHFEVITKTGGEGGSVIDVSAKGDLSAKADAQASGSHEAEVFVDGGKHGGDMTKFVYTPGQIRADADANAQAAGHLGYAGLPGHFMGQLKADAAAKSDLAFDGGSFSFTHYGDEGHLGDIKAALKGDLEAAADAQVSGSHDAAVRVDGGKKGGSSFELKYHPGQVNAQAAADANVAGHYGIYGGPFGGKGHLAAAADANAGLSYDGGHFEVITKTGGEGGSVIDVSAKGDLSAKADAQASGSHEAEVFVDGGKHGGDMTKFVYTPGQIRADADANAQAAGHLGYAGLPGHFMGQLKADAAAKSDLAFDGGSFSFTHYGDEGHLGDIKAALKGDLEAAADAQVSGSHDAAVRVDGGKKGGSSFELKYHPGQVNAQAAADANVAGHYGIYGGPFGGKGHLAAAADANAGLSYDGGHFEVITKTGGEGGSVIDVSAKGDLSAKADAQASGSHEAEVFVDGGKHGGDMTKFVYTPGQIRADADANAQAAGHLGYAGLPGHFMGQLKADAAAKSDLAFDGGSFSFTHYGDEGHLGDIKAALKGDLEAAADAQVSGSHDAAVRVDGGKKGGSSFELKYHPGQVNAQAAADANVAGHYGIYGGPFGGKGHLAAAADANAGLSYDGGHFEVITKTGGEGGSVIDVSAKGDLSAKADAQASGSHEAEVFVDGGKHGGDMTKFVYTPGQIRADADANAQAAGHLGYAGLPGHFMGQLKADAAAKSDLAFDGGSFSFTHYGDEGHLGDIKAALKGDLEAAADAQVSGSHDAAVRVDGGKKGGSSFELKYHPGQVNAQAAADANVAGHYGIYGGPFGGKGHLAAAADANAGLSYDGGHFEVITKTGGEGGSVIDVSAKGDLSAKADAQASGSHEAEVFVDGGKHGGDMTKFVYTPGQIRADADANAQAAGHLGYAGLPGHFMGQLKADAAAKSDLAFDGGSFSFTHYGDEGHLGDIKAALKGDLEAAADAQVSGSHDAAVRVDGGKKGGSSFELKYHPGQVNAQAAADANVAGHYGIYGGPFGGKGHLAAAADANAGLSYDGGHFEVITKTGGEGGSVIDVSAKGDLSAKADAQASGSHEAEVFVDGGKHGGDMTKFVYTPGQIRADADANAQAAGHLGYAGLPGHFMGQLKADAAAKSDLAFDGGSFSFTHYGDEGHLGDIKAALKGDLEAAADAQVSGSHDAAVRVDGGKKGGSSFELKYHPGQVNAQAAADANVAGHYGIYGGPFGGKGHLAAAADANAGLSYDGGHFEVITKTGGEGGSVIDVSAKGDLSAKADAQASGSHEAEVFVDGGKHGGDMTKFVYTPGQIRADADANAQAAGHLGYAGLPGHFMGQLKADAAAKSDLAFDGGSFSFTHYGDEGHLGDIKAALKGDLEAAADAQVSGSHDAAVRVDGGKKGGSSFELKYHPGQVNAQAAADANVAGHYGIYGGPFGGKGHLAAAADANAGLSYDGGHFEVITKTGEEGGSVIDVSAKGDLSAKADAQASGSHEAEVFVDGGKHGGDMTKFVYTPGQIRADADANAQAAGHLGYAGLPGHFMGQLKADAAAKSDLAFDGGSFSFTHYGDEGHLGDIKAALKGDLEAAADAQVSGSHDAAVRVDGGKKGGSSFELKYHPGQVNAQAAADANVAGHYGIYGGPFGGKGHLAAAADANAGLSYDGGHFEVITKTGGEGGSVIDVSAKGDLSAKADAQASGSHEAEVFVDGGKHGRDMTKFVYTPGQIRADADANAQAAGHLGYAGLPGHFMGQLKADAAAKSDLAFDGGSFSFTHYGDEGHLGDIKAALKGDLEAAADAQVSGSHDAAVRVDGGKKGGSSFELKYHPGQVNAQAAADANVAGHYGIYGGPFGGKGHLAAAADANAGLSYDGGHFEVITKTGGEGGSVIDVSAKGDLSAKADAQASGSHEAEVFVDGGKHGGDMTKFVYTPGQIRADADANAQAAGHLGYAGLPGHFMGQLKADAAAKSDLAFDGGSFSFTHYGDEGHLGDIKAALKGDLEAAADAQVSGSHDAAVRVDGGKKGGSSFELKYHPGQVNAQAAADANVAGHYGIYGGPFGGKGHLAAAADANAGLSYDGGHFEVITKTGGEGGSVIDVSAKGDLSAKADAQASGSHEAEVFVDGGKHGGDMTKFVYTPGQIRADADANAQAAGHLGYAGLPGHFMGQLKADAAAKSDLAFDGGSFSFTHYGDEGHLGDIKAALKGDLEAAADAQVSGSHDAAVRVDGGKKGGSSFELKYHPGQVNAQAAADANVAGHYGIYGGPFGGKGHLAAAADANAGLSYDGGHFEVITKTGGEGGSVIDVSAKGDLSAKADAQASGSHEAEVFVDGGKHGGDMTKFVYTPGQIRADADANAQAAGHLGYAGLPGHFMGQLKADAAAKSDLAFDGGSFSFTHYGDEGHLGDIKAALKGDLEAAADAQVSGSHDAAVRVDGGKKGGSSFELKYHPGQVNAQAAADANVAGHYGIYGGPFGGKGHLAAAADANAGLSYDGGHFEVITKTGGEGGSVIDVSAKGDLSAKADAQASGSHEAEVFVDGGKHGGDMTKFVYTPGQIRADADANAQAAGHLGYAGLPGHFMGQLKADAAAKSDLAFDGGSFSFTHYGDEGHLGDIKAALKGDLEAAADAQVSGSHDAAVRVDGGKKGGSSFELKYHPGQVNAQAAADANVAGHYGIYGGPFGGKGHLAAAADANAGLSYDGGHFEVITKTGGEGGSVIDVSAKGDLSAKADAQASGSHEAEVFVDGGKHGGDMTKFVYTPGQIRADADANAQAAGHLGYAGLPGHFMGQLKADAAAKSDLAFDGGSFSFTHYGDEGHLGDIKAALKGDLEAAADAQVSGSHDAAVRVDGGKKGGSSFELKYHPGQVNAQAAADANVAGHYGIYGGPFGGKGHLAAAADANAGLSYDGGHFEVITKTGGEGGSVIDVSAKGDLSAKADAQASGSHEAEVFVDGGKHGGDMTKFVYTPGQIRADADANAQAAGHLGYAGLPGHFMGQLKADAAAKSDLAFDGGSFSFTHYGDEGHLGDIKAALKGDLEAAADAQVSGSHDAAVRVDGGKKGGSSFELKYHPGQVNAQAAADANVAGHYGIYGGPFGGKGHLAAAADANAGLSYDGGHFGFGHHFEGTSGAVVSLGSSSSLAAYDDSSLFEKSKVSLSSSVVDSPVCVDEFGGSRFDSESWYKNGDACVVCSCSSSFVK